MPTLHAQPYDTSATGFYFTSEEDFQEKFDARLPVEEYEIQFIDGTDQELTLYRIVDPCQSTLAKYFDLIDQDISDDHMIALSYLVDSCGYDLKDGLNKMEDVQIFEGSAEDYARDFVDECYDLPEIAQSYFNYEQFANDLMAEGSITEVETGVYVTNSDEF